MEPENQPPADSGDPFWNTIVSHVFFVFLLNFQAVKAFKKPLHQALLLEGLRERPGFGVYHHGPEN